MDTVGATAGHPDTVGGYHSGGQFDKPLKNIRSL